MNTTFYLKKVCFSLLASAILVLSGCTGDDDIQLDTPRPDVSGIKINFTIDRFDQALFSTDTTKCPESLRPVAQQYPDLLSFFLTQVIHDPRMTQVSPEDELCGYLTSPQVRRLNDTVQAHFVQIKPLEKELETLLKYYKHYFPQQPTPRIGAAVTEFIGDIVPISDTLLMLGLDMFLGKNFEGYNPDDFPTYIRRQFEPPYIPVRTALVLANQMTPPPAQDRIIDHMIRNGKVLYIMDCLLPDMHDSLKIGYTTEQWMGAFSNEANVWARLLDMKVLYEPVSAKNRKIIEPAPSADNVFQEAPGEIGNWVGWQIVHAYMKRHPNTTMQQLLSLNDAQQFLEKSRYRPRRE